jgi:PPP family 3-phenylpropionic acid transporter
MQNKDHRRFTAASFYFIFYAGGACLFPFLTLFYAERGLTGTQIGFLSALPPMINLFAAPFWTALADSTGKHKQILMLTIVGAISASMLVLYAGKGAWIILMIAILAFLSAPIMPLMDNESMRMLGGKKQQYGRIRMWGAIGWGVSAPVLGGLIETYGLQWSFWGYAALIFIGFLVASRLEFSSGGVAGPFWQGMKHFGKNHSWLLFLSVVFIGSVSLSTVSNYMFLYMDNLGISKWIMGIALTVATISEIPVLYFANRLLEKMNAFTLMLLALFFVGMRVLLLSFASTAVMFLLIQLLHGFSFSLAWSAGVSFADQIAPPGLTATAQGMYAAVQLGIGTAAGAILGGFLYQTLGAVQMYRIIAVMITIAIPVFYLLDRRLRNNEKGMIYEKAF